MNTLLFCIVEGLSGLRRSKFSGFLTIITVSISIYFIGAFIVLSNSFFEIVEEIRAKVVLEAFISEEMASEQIAELNRELYLLAAVDSVYYVSKDAALVIFKETFGDDYAQLIDENPLPSSFQVFLKKKYLNSDSVQSAVAEISQIQGVENVIYRGKLLQILDQYYQTAIGVMIFIGIGLSLIGFILVSNNIRLTISAKKRIIETMLLVGATRALVRGPFLVQGMLEGIAGSLAAMFFLMVTTSFGNWYFGSKIMQPPSYFYFIVLVAGTLYGTLGSLYAMRGRI
ncbi:MAG: cell division protein FtsX [bacterium]